MTCAEARTDLLLGGSPEATAHRTGCPACAAAAGRAALLHHRLAAYTVGEPGPGNIERTLAAAAPLLAARAAALRGPRRRLVGAVTVVLAVLPLLVVVDAQLVRAAHLLLSSFLPAYLTSYLVGSLAVTLALLLALSCAAVPLLAARQRLRPSEVMHV